MSNKPPIYGFCPAGCRWETMHKEDVEKLATYREIDANENATYNLEFGKKYRIIYPENYTDDIVIKLNYVEDGVDKSTNLVIDNLNTFDKNLNRYFDFELTAVTAPSTNPGGSLTYSYLVMGMRTDTDPTEIGLTNIPGFYQEANNIITVENAETVYLYDYKGEFVSSVNNAWIMYATDINGSNMSATWDSTKKYIGTYSGIAVSNNPSDYTWAKFVGDDGTGGYPNIILEAANFSSITAAEQIEICTRLNTLIVGGVFTPNFNYIVLKNTTNNKNYYVSTCCYASDLFSITFQADNDSAYVLEALITDNSVSIASVSTTVPIKKNVASVPSSSWVADTTYTGYGYRAAIEFIGVNSLNVVEVIFGFDEAVSGNYAPVCQSYNGGVYIYSKVNTTINGLTLVRVV